MSTFKEVQCRSEVAHSLSLIIIIVLERQQIHSIFDGKSFALEQLLCQISEDARERFRLLQFASLGFDDDVHLIVQ